MNQTQTDEQIKDRRAQRQAYIHQLETAYGARRERITKNLARVEAQIKALRGAAA